ncbi:MAG: hypothetical protein ACLRFP_04360 [Alphaproteobacteria bacterium]
MIEKLNIDPTQSVATNHCIISKINELCDTVNTIQKEREAERFEIQEWIGILESVRKSVNKHGKLIDTLVVENNIHEKQIDELQMRDEDLTERINYTLAKATGNKEVLKLLDEKYKPVDRFAEQRKWIGKLCKFWFADAEHPIFGILDFVDAGPHPEPFHINCGESEQGWYPHCEPVKPDEDIIYKGGDNEK